MPYVDRNYKKFTRVFANLSYLILLIYFFRVCFCGVKIFLKKFKFICEFFLVNLDYFDIKINNKILF